MSTVHRGLSVGTGRSRSGACMSPSREPPSWKMSGSSRALIDTLKASLQHRSDQGSMQTASPTAAPWLLCSTCALSDRMPRAEAWRCSGRSAADGAGLQGLPTVPMMQFQRNSRSIRSLTAAVLSFRRQTLSERLDMGGELGSTQRCGRAPSRLRWRWMSSRREYANCADDAAVVSLHHPGRGAYLGPGASRCRSCGRAHEPQHRRNERDVGLLP